MMDKACSKKMNSRRCLNVPKCLIERAILEPLGSTDAVKSRIEGEDAHDRGYSWIVGSIV